MLLQVGGYISDSGEDCLYLSVHVPQNNLESDAALPVMVFIHGESYDSGTGNAYGHKVIASCLYATSRFVFLFRFGRLSSSARAIRWDIASARGILPGVLA